MSPQRESSPPPPSQGEQSLNEGGALEPGAVVGYLIPEFPGQTHIWMWRELTHLREWDVRTRIFSTRRPPERDRARHAFAKRAEAETLYLWPRSWGDLARSLAWAAAGRPRRFVRALRMLAALPLAKGGGWRAIPLIVPASVLAREARRLGVRHLHVHSCASSAVIAMAVRELAGIPYSLTLNADLEWWGGALAEKFGRAAFVVAITERLVRQVRRDYPALRGDQVLLGRIGVDTRRWPAKEPARRMSAPWRVVTVGRLHASKGHDVLIHAVAALLRSGHEVELRMIGAGPEREALERLASDLGISASVTFAGSLPEEGVIAELVGADVFVLASHAEPLGVAYMEAMATGTPTVGTAAGGVAEIITDGVDGLLTRPGDADDLARTIERLIRDGDLRERLGRAGRRRIEEAFDSRIGAAALYRRLFGRPAPAEESGAAEEEGVGAAAGA